MPDSSVSLTRRDRPKPSRPGTARCGRRPGCALALPSDQRAAVAAVVRRWPRSRSWARLGDLSSDAVDAYAPTASATHRGSTGCGPTVAEAGYVRWEHEENQGFCARSTDCGGRPRPSARPTSRTVAPPSSASSTVMAPSDLGRQASSPRWQPRRSGPIGRTRRASARRRVEGGVRPAARRVLWSFPSGLYVIGSRQRRSPQRLYAQLVHPGVVRTEAARHLGRAGGAHP